MFRVTDCATFLNLSEGQAIILFYNDGQLLVRYDLKQRNRNKLLNTIANSRTLVFHHTYRESSAYHKLLK